MRGNTSRKETAPFLCLRFAVFGVLLGPSEGGVSRPGVRADQHGLHARAAANQRFRSLDSSSIFSLVHNSKPTQIMLKIIPFYRVQWILEFLKRRGTNTIVPYPMEAVGYKHRDRQRWGLKGKLRSWLCHSKKTNSFKKKTKPHNIKLVAGYILAEYCQCFLFGLY